MPRVLKALDVFMLCSRHEGFGRVVAEAMAAGTPMVLSREGALPEVVASEGRGLLALPGDPRDFAGRFAEMVGRSKNPATHVRDVRFDSRAVAQRVLRAYVESGPLG
jgi:glycosyltransferase involved in cell wall biosynthesis